MKKGSSSIPILVVLGAVTTFFTGWAGWNSTRTFAVESDLSDTKVSIEKRFGGQDAVISALGVRADITEKRMDRFEAKLDALLEKNNVDPQKINAKFGDITLLATTTIN